MRRSVFKKRRSQLMQAMGKGSIAILPTAASRIRSRDVEHPYRPDSDFIYLTGFSEPEAVAVLRPGHEKGEYLLFCRERDPDKELWNGLRAGLDGAKEHHGADEAMAISRLNEELPRMLEGCDRLYYAFGCHPELDQCMAEWLNRIRTKSRSGVQGPREIILLDHLLHEMRLVKSDAEVEAMRSAAAIAAAGHIRMMRTCKSGIRESQLEAEFLHECAIRGAREASYPAIVGGGANACILHYTENADELRDGDLVLIDAGCEHDYYASDITRTFPVNGRFTHEQRELYQLVLDAQHAAIAEVKPGSPCTAPHDAAVKVLVKGLIRLGLLKGPPSRQIKKGGYKKFYMHRTSHWLGMDVHDVGGYGSEEAPRLLQPGMVMTIEPGLYIPKSNKEVAKKWRGIGIRIEDDLLVTEQGHEILSAAVPKEINEIEALMAP